MADPREKIRIESVQDDGALRMTITLNIDRTATGIEEMVKRALLEELMQRHGGDVKTVARILGVVFKTVYNRLNTEKLADDAGEGALTMQPPAAQAG